MLLLRVMFPVGLNAPYWLGSFTNRLLFSTSIVVVVGKYTYEILKSIDLLVYTTIGYIRICCSFGFCLFGFSTLSLSSRLWLCMCVSASLWVCATEIHVLLLRRTQRMECNKMHIGYTFVCVWESGVNRSWSLLFGPIRMYVSFTTFRI